MSIFSDIATQTAFGNSIDIKRYHGGISTILCGGLTYNGMAGLGPDGRVPVYLAAIPWHARILNISLILETATTPTTAVSGNFYMRGMRDKTAKNSAELSSLDYEQILGTQADYNAAIANANGYSGNIAIHQTLAGATLADNNTTEIPLYGSAITLWGEDAQTVNTMTSLALPFKGRICTPAEAMSYYVSLPQGSGNTTGLKYAANALPHVKDQYGMLTWIPAAGAGGTDGAVLIRIDYVDPAPSAVASGKLIRNTQS